MSTAKDFLDRESLLGGALKPKPPLPTFAANTEASMRQSEYCLESITTRVPPEVLQAVERAAAAERRSVSSFLRNVVCDWAARRQQHAAQEGR